MSCDMIMQDGRVQPGDQVLLVNGHNLLGRSNSDAMSALKKAMDDINPNTKSIQLVCIIFVLLWFCQLLLFLISQY